MKNSETVKVQYDDRVEVFVYDNAPEDTYLEIHESDTSERVLVVLTPKQVKKLRKALKKARR